MSGGSRAEGLELSSCCAGLLLSWPVAELAAQEAAAADPVEVVAPDFDEPEESEDFDPDESEEPDLPASEEAATFVSDFSDLTAPSDLPDFLAAARLSVL